ncbi:EAL domain-containing protein [Enterobacter sp. RHBSTW-00994]|uniref:EAL domain-containing protein n=1 Tax=Enterobacteriaceae TaxID=543 RepID=UPI0015E9801F|nr:MULTISPECIES: EAL domain-containing protein [Enterobacteriaceae]MBM3069792.1 EAL domain-containing protein [Lelliottia sp. RWM.1]QLR42161.1 EAL domain-containing protein [Enterobacter sp. RHBSTW-00994]
MNTLPKNPPATLSGLSAFLARFFGRRRLSPFIPPAKALNLAIHSHQIVPFYQPFIDGKTGKIAGVEVLARWKHPLYGYISPDIFIPVAEENNLIAPLTHQLIQQVISDLQHQIQLFPDGLYICINLSAHNCFDPHFEKDTVELLHRLAASHVHLVIEITERHPMHFTPQLSEWFATLRKSDISVALDDFGTGYSNLSYIYALNPEFIKIDKLFVSQIGENSDTRLVDSLIELVKKMHLTIIAEGVETQAQADYLRAKNIDFLQGYYFCRPIPANELIRMVAEQREYAC